MNSHPSAHPNWDTASIGQPASVSAMEHRALSAHLSECDARRARMQRLWSGAGGFWQMMATRVVSTALAVTSLLVLVLLLR